MQSSGDRAALEIRESVELIGRDETLAALTERVRSFDKATRAMLDVMAVIGDEATSMMLAHVTATSQSQVLAVVDPAIAANVIRQTEPGVYQFSHPLFRAAV